jgi:hypothetical protein
VGLGIVVVIFFLWRIASNQQTANHLSAVNTARALAADTGNAVVQQFGTWQEAIARARTIEYMDNITRFLGQSDAEVRQAMLSDPTNTAGVLVAESLSRGLHCRFLAPEDYLRHSRLLPPGLAPARERNCAEYCHVSNHPDDEWIEFPDDCEICPFCSGQTVWTDPDAIDVEYWENWQRFRHLFPAFADAENREAEQDALREHARARAAFAEEAGLAK